MSKMVTSCKPHDSISVNDHQISRTLDKYTAMKDSDKLSSTPRLSSAIFPMTCSDRLNSID